MIKIVFVGDSPSKTNVNPDLAFIGSRCLNTLIEWINIIKPDYYICLNSHNNEELNKILDIHSHNFSIDQKFKFIALGNNSSKILNSLLIKHFKLPHPSGRNRILNNKDLMDLYFNQCKEFLNENL